MIIQRQKYLLQKKPKWRQRHTFDAVSDETDSLCKAAKTKVSKTTKTLQRALL